MSFSVGSLLGYLEIGGVPQALSGVRSVQESLDLTATAAKRTGVAIDSTSGALANAGRQADVAAAGSARFKAAQLTQVAAQERYNKLAAEGNASTGRLAAAQASLVRANERVRATTPIAPEALTLTDSMRGKITGLIGDTAKLAGGFALIGAAFEVGNAIKQANAFQRQMLLLQTQTGATAGEVSSMTKAVLALSPQVATGPEALALSLYHVESVGLRGAKALDVVRIAAEGAKVGNANLEETTNALTATVASGIPGVQNMAQAMSALNATVGAGDMKLSDLNEALGSGVLTVVKGYGLSLRDVGAALTTFGDNNIRGAEAATMLRMAVQAMSHPAAEGAKQLDLLGLKTDTLAKDMQTAGLNKAVLDLNAHLKSAGDTGVKTGAVLTDIFGKRAGPGLAVLIGQVDRLQSKYTLITEQSQTFGSAWDATTKTAAFGFDKLKATADATAVSIFSKVGPVLGQVASDVGVVLPSALHLLESAVAPLGGVFSVFAGALKGSGGAAHDLSVIFHDLEPVLGVIGPLVIGVWAGFKAGEVVVGTVKAVQSAMETMALKVMYAKDAVLAFGSAQSTAAAESGVAGAAIAEDAAATSTAVVASGESAAVGWAGLAGPIGAAVVGVGVIISLFHKSTGASKEATSAAKAYADALSGSGAGLTDAITAQLSSNKVPEAINKLNAALGQTKVNGKDFVDAISAGGPALDALRSKLQGVVKDGTSVTTVSSGKAVAVVQALTPAAQAAQKLLGDLNTQADVLSAAVQKDLVDTKAFAGVSSSIDKVTAATTVGTQTAATYAHMLGITVDKNGVAAVSADVLDKAVTSVAAAYATASQTGNDFLGALNAFSNSAGTAADRAALIGATLKTANGDALAFAGTMNAYAQSTSTFATDVANNAQTAGESVGRYLSSLVSLKTGTIDYSKAAAAPLINDLQGIQTAALNAAQATYQHELATVGGKKAADDAYNQYRSQTSGALTDEFTKLTGNASAAKAFADQYFGIANAADIKKTIEMEGSSPVVDVLNQIGTQLSFLTGHAWVVPVTITTVGNLPASATAADRSAAPPHVSRAAGGAVSGSGTGTSDSINARLSNGEFVVRASQAAKHRDLLDALNTPGFATGGSVGDFTVKAKAASHHTTTKVDVGSISVTADGGVASAIADIITSNIPAVKTATADLSAAVNEAFTLRGVEAKLTAAKAALANLQKESSALQTSVTGTLAGGVDVSKFGDIGGLLDTFSTDTAANQNFAAELSKLAHEGLAKGLISQLAAAGPSAGLDTLAGASQAQVNQVNAAFGAFSKSATVGGSLAANAVYGAQIAADRKNVTDLTKQAVADSHSIARLVAAVAKLTGRPVEVMLDNKVIAKALFSSKEFDGVLDAITKELLYR